MQEETQAESHAEKQVEQRDGELFTRIVGHIGEFVERDVSYLTPRSHVANSIEGMSSLKMIELLLYLEDCFGVDFDESVMEKLETLQDLEDYIRGAQDLSGQQA
ncbi:phosphopantetheine-binding protein [Streptomyces murinus]|uniref:Acyl carrier protein n=1 Tax=Streptomyces murinus TaxID=33900 RepID=A0A7W3RPX6_STRMR|nr:phosphopantetheine-binding protein [Streptomyces murinus]MBA9057825.1 acyl carrier protein [Streptomyces murinus]UWW92066.1 acyl carrier protein [Streptomyces murinus]